MDNVVEVSPEEEREFYEHTISERLLEQKTDKARREYVRNLPQRIKTIFEERNPRAWSQFAAELSNIDGASPGAAHEIANSSYGIRVATFETLTAYEHELRRYIMRSNGFSPLTPDLGITYGIHRDIAHLHFGPSRTIKRKKEQMINGMHTLARLVKTHPELQQIEEVIARSWIVTEHPRIFELSGFTLVAEEGKEKPELATISRADLLERFGEK